jgi:hypothetical protein
MKRSGLAPTATIRELKHLYAREMEIPVIKQSIDEEDALLVLQVATALPLTLLFVLLDSMRSVIEQMKKNGDDLDAVDCIFYYRSWSAFPVAVLWLLMPIVCFVLQSSNLRTHLDSTGAALAALFTCAVPILALLCIHRGWKARRAYFAP